MMKFNKGDIVIYSHPVKLSAILRYNVPLKEMFRVIEYPYRSLDTVCIKRNGHGDWNGSLDGSFYIDNFDLVFKKTSFGGVLILDSKGDTHV
jgi:hypothetical protein